MAPRWIGLAPPRKSSRAKGGVGRALSHALRGIGASSVFGIALAYNVVMFPDAYAQTVAGIEEHVPFLPGIAPFAPIPADVLARVEQPAVAVSEAEVRLLAATAWGEARSEGEDGMRAVAHVMVNRIGDRFGEDLATVILSPRQFSVWNRGDPNRRLVLDLVRDPSGIAGDPAWAAAQRIAREVLSGQSVDPTGGALFYHTRAIRPRWSRQGQGRQVIGAHIFYADVPDRGRRPTPPRVVNVAEQYVTPVPVAEGGRVSGVLPGAAP